MTKERRLAIKLWEEIKANLPGWFDEDFNLGGKITEYKTSFAVDNNLNWYNDCWFCQYIPDCPKCPLGYCSIYNSLFKEQTLSEHMIACDIIIGCLKGNLKVRGSYDKRA